MFRKFTKFVDGCGVGGNRGCLAIPLITIGNSPILSIFALARARARMRPHLIQLIECIEVKVRRIF